MKENITESREYEIEVRSFVSENDFDFLLQKLNSLFGKPKIKEMRTFLFKGEGFARIRIYKGENQAVLTKKIGELSDKARQEINKDFYFTEVETVLQELDNDGFEQCSYLNSIRYTFDGKNGEKLELSKHSNLGSFLEIEQTTTHKSKINDLYAQVNKTLKDVGLQELSSSDYQKKLDIMYKNTLKPVELYKSEIVPF